MGDVQDQTGDKRKRWKARRDSVRAADKKAMRVATRQWGALTRQQALKTGLTRNQIACLAGPADTAASHLSAAALFRAGQPPEAPQVTIPSRASGRFKGSEIFRGPLGPGETCLRRRIRFTKPTRTVVDCAAAGMVEGEALWDLVDSALCKKLMQPSRLVRASGRPWLHPGVHSGFIWSNSSARSMCGDQGLGPSELKILFEYDSDEHHGPRCWRADDARRERIEELGWTVVVVDRFDLRPSSTRLKETLSPGTCRSSRGSPRDRPR